MKTTIKTLALVAAATLASLTLPAPAADLGGRAPTGGDSAESRSLWNGCYADAGGSAYLADGYSAIRAFAIGAGCDANIAKRIVLGAGLTYAIAQDGNALALNGRLGYVVNPHVLAYGKLSWVTDGKSPSTKDSLFVAGGGIETYIASNVTIYGEIVTDIAKYGVTKEIGTLYTATAGLRYRF
jgi:hypothetical protein